MCVQAQPSRGATRGGLFVTRPGTSWWHWRVPFGVLCVQAGCAAMCGVGLMDGWMIWCAVDCSMFVWLYYSPAGCLVSTPFTAHVAPESVGFQRQDQRCGVHVACERLYVIVPGC